MPKPNKSSASSGTRKKYARKAAGGSAPEQPPKDKEKGKKKDKKAPKVKMYIPPPKFTPIRPDPLDLESNAELVQRLPAELVVLLRNLGKKSVRTRERALEGLTEGWLGNEEMLPIWTFHLPTLLIQPSRRIRLLACTVQESLTGFAGYFSQGEVLGSWVIAAHDVDRNVATSALGSLSKANPQVEYGTLNFIHGVILEPQSLSDERGKADEVEEQESDRNARIRVGAIGALAWVIETSKSVPEFVTERRIWSLLPISPDNLPSVRKAMWGLLNTLISVNKDSITSPLASFILRSAFQELDPSVQAVLWRPTLALLSYCPQAWSANQVEEDDSADESDEEHSTTHSLPSPYTSFLSFLSSSCNSSPQLGYPAIIILLSSLPSEVILLAGGINPLFDAFWSPYTLAEARTGLRAEQTKTDTAFLSSLLECTSFILKRGLKDTSLQQELETLATFVAGQVSRIWESTTGSVKQLRLEPEGFAPMLSKFLVSLEAVSHQVFDQVWTTLTQLISASLPTPSVSTIVPLILGDLLHAPSRSVKEKALELKNLVLGIAVKPLSTGSSKETEEVDLTLLTKLLLSLKEDALSERLDDLIQTNGFMLLLRHPDLLPAYVTCHASDQSRLIALWQSLLKSLPAHAETIRETLPRMVAFARDRDYLRPSDDSTDQLIQSLLQRESAGDWDILKDVLKTPMAFLYPQGYKDLLTGFGDRLKTQFNQCINLREVPESGAEREELERKGVEAQQIMEIFSIVFGIDQDFNDTDFQHGRIRVEYMPYVFLYAHLLSHCSLPFPTATFEVAKNLWEAYAMTPYPSMGETQYYGEHNFTFEATKDILVELPMHILLPTPDLVIKTVPELARTGRWKFPFNVQVYTHILSRHNLDQLCDVLPTKPQDASLAVFDSLIPPPSVKDPPPRLPKRPVRTKNITVTDPQQYDSRGFSVYARCIIALLDHFMTERKESKNHIWVFKHFVMLGIFIEETLALPNLTSPVFAPLNPALESSLREIGEKISDISRYLLIAPLQARQGPDWREKVLESIMEDKEGHYFDYMSLFILDSLQDSLLNDTVREARLLGRALKVLFQDITDRTETELWLKFAKWSEADGKVLTSMEIIRCLCQYAPEPKGLERYRTEVATSLLGVKPAKANTLGFDILRKLVACAPKEDSDVEFLTQPRAVNVIKALQSWIAADVDDEEEEVNEEVESLMTEVFIHLVPILQTVPGGHWDFIFDMVENNLEAASFEDSLGQVTLSRTLRLIIAIQELTSTNKTLRADWEKRQTTIMKLVKGLASIRLEPSSMSAPRSICRELVLSIVQDLPEALIDKETLPKMCHLLTDSSVEVQKMSFQLLQQAAKKRTEYLVIEAGVDVDDSFKAELPQELLVILQDAINLEHEGQVFGQLLGWILLFNLFTEASLKVRISYLEQIRTLELIPSWFMPTILMILGLDQGLAKAFKLDGWSVEEYYVQFYEPGTNFSIQAFAAHVYYRALLTVPSLIYSWLQECKDRQVSTALTTCTSTHFSAVIIRKELGNVKDPQTLASLETESLKIKVAMPINEVSLSYLVDDHQLEIKLKIPLDWPLHKIEIKDVKRVGVDENRWRAWIFGIQQTIWAQNGRLIDGLELFKKNVTLHFEGQVECAICYSIISVMDGSLPKKPCKTCKNRFHAGCLFKWFNTSHSSSCPLCRSDIL